MELKLHYLFLYFLNLTIISGFYFKGGTINWRSLGNRKVQFYERLGYGLHQGPGCSVGHSGQLVSKLNDDYWKCTNGCAADDKIADVNYYCGSVNTVENWEQGDKTFTFTFPSTGPFTVSYTANDTVSSSYIQTTVDLRLRSDTNDPNSSPVTASKPLYQVSAGCVSVIRIPATDPDGDKVFCRWATSSEHGSLYDALPSATLDESECKLTIDTSVSGYVVNTSYQVALTLEDRPATDILLDTKHYSNTSALSTVPLQFTVYVVQPQRSCNDTPTIHSDTPTKISVPEDGVLKFNIYAVATGPSSTIKEFVASSPKGLTLSKPLNDDKGRPNVWYSEVTWAPNSDQSGTSIVCIEALDDTGMQSPQTTILIQADNVNYCDPNPCRNGGTCTSHGTSYTCSCTPGYFGLACESVTSASCSDPDDSYCMCDINGKPAKVPFPQTEEESVSSKDLISGMVGFPIGAAIGVALCSIWRHWLRRKCSKEESKRPDSVGSITSASSLGSMGKADLRSLVSSSNVSPRLPTDTKLGWSKPKSGISRSKLGPPPGVDF